MAGLGFTSWDQKRGRGLVQSSRSLFASYHRCVPRKKSELIVLLEKSIKAVKSGEFPKAKRDSLGNRLRTQDGLDRPDALEVGPEALSHDGVNRWGDDDWDE